MRAAVYYSNQDIRVEERPVPQIGPGELLIKIQASGICGTDVLEWYRRDKTPLILGHEIAGIIEEAGQGVSKYKKGDRISASHHVPCGKCVYCKRAHQTVCDTLRKTHFDPGGFVEYLRLPKINLDLGGVYPIPKNVSFEEATFTEPLACVLRGASLAGVSAGKSVLVMGCGVSGLLHIKAAVMLGASRIFASDVVDYRLNFAEKSGADVVMNTDKEDIAARIRLENQDKGVDIVIVATGAKTANAQALELVERAGTVLFFAAMGEGETINLSVNEVFWRNEITLTSSYAAAPEEHLKALKLISEQKIRVHDLITHRLKMDQIQKGFNLVAQARDSMKVVIQP